MRQPSFIILALTCLTGELFGQKLVDFKYSPCDGSNRYSHKMNTTVNRVDFRADSMLIVITWIDNCTFDPNFSLRKVVGDTIYFRYKNKEGGAACNCAFRLQFTLAGIYKKDYQIKVNNWPAIDKKARRYRTDGYVVEYFPERTLEQKKMREIFSTQGKLVAEVFYDKEGNITSEKFYNENWGFFEYEKKY